MLPTRAIFLDRDGTIIEDKGHIASQEDIELYPYAIRALLALQEKYLLFIVTNQSGVSLGRITLAEAIYVNEYLMEVLAKSGVTIREFYCCSHKRDDHCDCIKPKPYFINKARAK
jgi:histidinol-phosphate phosphatase family protein